MMAAAALGVEIGPLIAGALLERFWWGSVFVVTIPLAVVALALVLVPLLQTQVLDFAGRVPHYIDLARGKAMELLDLLRSQLSAEEISAVRAKIGSVAGPDTLSLIGKTLGRVWGGGVALFNLLSLLFVTPIVAFYLLRDWNTFLARVDNMIPRHLHAKVRQLLREIDAVLAEFLRGQIVVILVMCVYYVTALWLARLQFCLL